MRVFAVGALLAVGCYHPTVATDVPCAPGGVCPHGLVCDQTVSPPTFVVTPSTPDAMVDAEILLDVCGDTGGLKADAPWPIVHGCPTNAGRSAHLGPMTGMTALDPTGTNTARRGAVVAAGNHVVVQESYAGVISSFDAKTGMQLWTYTGTAGSGIEPTPVIDSHGVLYATTNYGKLFALDVVSGMELWTLQLGGAFSAPVIGPPGTVYYGSNGPYGFYAVDTEMRKQRWHYDVPNMGDAVTAAAIGNGRIYFVDTKNSRLFALDAATGAHVYDVAVDGTAVGSAVLGVDTLYVATKTSGIEAFDAATGTLVWQHGTSAAVVQPALLANGEIVSSTVDGTAFVLRRSNGDELYSVPLGGNLVGSPTIDRDETAFFPTDKGVVAIATKTRVVQWQSALVGPIVLADQKLVVLPAHNTLSVIGP